MVLGIRGIPHVQGGVETHAEQLYKRLAALGCQIEVLVRTPFVPPGIHSFGAIRIRRLWSPRQAGLEAFVHSLIGVLYAGITRPDILHIHAVGPAIVTPLARLFGLRVVVTHHGPDYDHDKWGGFARWVLKTGERFGMRGAHARIAISKVIADLIRDTHARGSVLIPNGVEPARLHPGTTELARFGLTAERYFLQVSRIVPEKRQLDLIRAFKTANVPGWKVALVGGLTPDAYGREVQAEAGAAASAGDGVVLTGFLKGAALAQLYTHAGAFILPSSHEGLPIALLEAMSYGLPVLASDIPANKEVGLPDASYFAVGDVAALAAALGRLAQAPRDEADRKNLRSQVARAYDWDTIAQMTLRVYRNLDPH